MDYRTLKGEFSISRKLTGMQVLDSPQVINHDPARLARSKSRRAVRMKHREHIHHHGRIVLKYSPKLVMVNRMRSKAAATENDRRLDSETCRGVLANELMPHATGDAKINPNPAHHARTPIDFVTNRHSVETESAADRHWITENVGWR